VPVAVNVIVDVVEGKAVTIKRGVEDAVSVELVVGVAVRVFVGVAVRVVVEVAVRVVVEVAVNVFVELAVGGGAVGLTEAISFPTVKSTPHTWGRDRVAEYTHVGFSLTPLICIVGPQARVSLNVRLQVDDTGASGPYN
jgi:hypothetical protein